MFPKHKSKLTQNFTNNKNKNIPKENSIDTWSSPTPNKTNLWFVLLDDLTFDRLLAPNLRFLNYQNSSVFKIFKVLGFRFSTFFDFRSSISDFFKSPPKSD